MTAREADAPLQGRHVNLPGVRLWVVDSGGDGTPVVLLHANTGIADSWRRQIDALTAQGFRAIAFDRRGWGRSQPDPASGPQPGTIADDLLALVEHLRLPAFHLVGIAGGGFAALDFAAWKPKRLHSLLVAASNGQFQEPAMHDFAARVDIPGLAAPEMRIYREVGVAYRAADPEGLARFHHMEQHARQPDAPPQPMRTPNTFAKIARIATPTLVMTAGADLIAPPALMAFWSRHLQNVRSVNVPDAGHSLQWEQPEAFNHHMMEWLQEQEKRRRDA